MVFLFTVWLLLWIRDLWVKFYLLFSWPQLLRWLNVFPKFFVKKCCRFIYCVYTLFYKKVHAFFYKKPFYKKLVVDMPKS